MIHAQTLDAAGFGPEDQRTGCGHGDGWYDLTQSGGNGLGSGFGGSYSIDSDSGYGCITPYSGGRLFVGDGRGH